MAFTKIVDSDLNDIGVIGLPDRPGLSTSAMQAKLEETARSVIIPKHNGLIDELEDDTASSNIGIQPPTGMTGATVQAVVNDIAEKVRRLDPESLSSKADKVTNAVEGNFAGLDSEGNLTDSGNKAADFAAASHTHTKSDITDFPTLATVATTGAYADLSGQPTLGTASALDVPASGNASSSQVVKGNDSRLSDDRNAADVYSWAKQSTKPSYTASEVGAIASTEKGANGGVAELDSNGKVPSAQLPSYVDDVEEYASLSDFPATGETGKIYIAKDTNKQYRWSGTAYVEISESLALGETSSTAYAGNKGKANADAISAIKDGATIDSFGDVETALGDYIQKSSTAGLVKNDGTIDTTSYVSDISGKADKVSSATSGNFAGLDSNGNLTDSGSKASDFLTQHQDISGKQDKTLSAQVEGQSTVEGALGALSSNKMSYADNGILGAKNFLDHTDYAMSASISSTLTDTGFNATADASHGYQNVSYYNVNYSRNQNLIVGKKYIVSLKVLSLSGNRTKILTYRNSVGTIQTTVDLTNVGEYSLEFTHLQDGYISIFINASSTAAGEENTISVSDIMVRLASDPDDTYEPYAQTNRELTVNKADNLVIAPVENGTTVQKSGGYAVGSHAIRNGAFITWKNAKAQGEPIADSDYDSGDMADYLNIKTADITTTNTNITLDTSVKKVHKTGKVAQVILKFTLLETVRRGSFNIGELPYIPYSESSGDVQVLPVREGNAPYKAIDIACYIQHNTGMLRINVGSETMQAGDYLITGTYITKY